MPQYLYLLSYLCPCQVYLAVGVQMKKFAFCFPMGRHFFQDYAARKSHQRGYGGVTKAPARQEESVLQCRLMDNLAVAGMRGAYGRGTG